MELGKIGHHVLPLVPLTPLDQRFIRKHLPDGRAKTLGAIDHAENPFPDVQSTVQEVVQEDLDQRLVFRAGLEQPQHHLLPFQANSQAEDHLILSKAFPVQEKRKKAIFRHIPLHQLFELATAHLDEPPGDTGGR